METISETRGRLTGAAGRPGQRKTSWSPSGSGSPAEIWENDKKKKKKNQFQSSPLLGCLILSVSHKVTRSSSRHVTPIMNSQFFELVQRGEGPIHVLNGPGDFILLEIPFFPRRNKDRPRCKKSTPRKTTAVAMLIKLYAAFTFRVRGEKCLRL